MKAEWRKGNQTSLDRGTKYHKMMEEKYLNLHKIVYDDVTLNVVPSKHDGPIKVGTSMKLEDAVYPELLIWMDSAKLAGQADLVTIKNGVVDILDYKTNKEIKTQGYKNWDGIESMLLYPCAHLPECEYSIYSLQLNLYMYMILRSNPKFKMGSMTLVHVSFDEDGNPTYENKYTVPDLQSDVRTIIELHKQEKI